ncbi:4-hydroxy-tetrahydrodipicolinate synthase [Cupriavidus plantarum]|uniref:4-hydroxy-tetrahydrodipicolinate synthase n=1 Tax=Cupriavidus plantarum TaxID=942865 RepID=A0A316EU37_9BURK|nr:4-hydroxy-tetrahydrodipicolinate synthase [Cupriavidus plantarum]NYH99063.1 4-hydroxy-tetrahydrodipicolinate synthase [Cupriavidus plantarum]PWK36287.1 4-hydroxy-tetrahydrodipicolinate synthase [Cupriavidus plantarum]REF02960.1 4-hydroxy-tetrahydrodipicolinate synthase [Cupriavidus plantarum]CAG2141860.1 4-hydroxy-tetrahydrodipicolinate synthase [Cupriavidus plantarum]SMR65377.1 4-hydroxy-tetrahydrodipicolinate synthase [Cupriavidus plantarum]
MPRTDGADGALHGGLWLPMITPMRDGELDLDAAQRLAAWYAAEGVDGLIVLGTTGEGGLLSDAERLSLTEAVCEAVRGVVPVMAGVGAVDTRAVCEQVRRLERFDLAGYLVPPPYYLRVSDEGIAWHVRRVASQTPRALMLYNVPKRTGASISPALALRLAAHGQVRAIKECDPSHMQALAAHDGIDVYCGEDAAILDHLLAGGAGAVPAAAHVRPDLFVQLLRLARAGDEAGARALFARLSPLIALLFSAPNPSPVKAALALTGHARDEVRLPLTPVDPVLLRRLEAALAQLPPRQTVHAHAA